MSREKQWKKHDKRRNIQGMAIHRTRKNKENPNFKFLVSWQPKPPSEARVNREQVSDKFIAGTKPGELKRAESLAQGDTSVNVKKNIVRSLILIGLILSLELVVYLAWSKFVLS